MNRWYEVSFIPIDTDTKIKFKIPFGEDILHKMYKEIQDIIFAGIVLKHTKDDCSMQESLKCGGYDIDINDSYETIKMRIIPLSVVKHYNINYCKEIEPCEGCECDSLNQMDHMGYSGCLSDKI